MRTRQQPAADTLTTLVFPPTWTQKSRAWAVGRGFSQADVDAIEADLRWFRDVRDSHAARRIADDAEFEKRWKETLRHEWIKEGFHA